MAEKSLPQKRNNIRIALDAMGSDTAPLPEVKGAIEANRELGIQILLVGDEKILKRYLGKNGYNGDGIEICHAPEVISMDDPPLTPLRKKRQSSVRIAAEKVRDELASGLVTAGNTGAAMATSKVIMGAIEGVDRPALATWIPNKKGMSLILDVGANSNCKPIHLEQFAIMGSLFASEVLKISNPRIGILSIGTEDIKGNELTKEVFKHLSRGNLNFIGNVESGAIFRGDCEVIVTDGFTGNIVLKTGEAIFDFMISSLKEGFGQSWLYKMGYLLSKPVFKGLAKKMDYAEYGGAFLLGVKGVTVICHGKSHSKAIKNAIRRAHSVVQAGLAERTQVAITNYMKGIDNGIGQCEISN